MTTITKSILALLMRIFGPRPLPERITRVIRKAEAGVRRPARADAVAGTAAPVPVCLQALAGELTQIIGGHQAGRKAELAVRLAKLRQDRPAALGSAFAAPIAGFIGAAAAVDHSPQRIYALCPVAKVDEGSGKIIAMGAPEAGLAPDGVQDGVDLRFMGRTVVALIRPVGVDRLLKAARGCHRCSPILAALDIQQRYASCGSPADVPARSSDALKAARSGTMTTARSSLSNVSGSRKPIRVEVEESLGDMGATDCVTLAFLPKGFSLSGQANLSG